MSAASDFVTYRRYCVRQAKTASSFPVKPPVAPPTDFTPSDAWASAEPLNPQLGPETGASAPGSAPFHSWLNADVPPIPNKQAGIDFGAMLNTLKNADPAVQGALAGGAVGAATGLLPGQKVLRNALVGAGIGGVAGGGVDLARYVTKLQQGNLAAEQARKQHDSFNADLVDSTKPTADPLNSTLNTAPTSRKGIVETVLGKPKKPVTVPDEDKPEGDNNDEQANLQAAKTL